MSDTETVGDIAAEMVRLMPHTCVEWAARLIAASARQGDGREHLIAAAPSMYKELQHVAEWLLAIADLDLAEVVADGGVTAGMVVQQEALGRARLVNIALATGGSNDA